MAKKVNKKTSIHHYHIKETSLLGLSCAALLTLSVLLMFLNAFHLSSFTYFDLMFGNSNLLNRPVVSLIILFVLALGLIVLCLLYRSKFDSRFYLLGLSIAQIVLAILFYLSPYFALMEGVISRLSLYGHAVASTIFASFILLSGLIALGYALYLVIKKKDA